MPSVYYDHMGKTIQLGQQIGAGGEGPVYIVQGKHQDCAKIYYKPTHERHQKIEAMLRSAPTDPTLHSGHRSIAWPSAALYEDSQKNRFAGFLMPIIDMKTFIPVLNCFDPEERLKLLGGGFNWLYLLTTAQNIASATAAIHERGSCIGDINESNMLVAPNTLTTLIDCDSFQIKDNSGKVYRCNVGKSEYTAPELHGQLYSSIDRTPQSDCFGLAVIIFQLLMDGNHPFRGIWQLAGDAPSLEEKIIRGYFPHGRKLREILPPPGVPPFEILHPQLQSLFTRCFVSGHKDPLRRPTASEWFDTFRSVRPQIAECSHNKNHRYFNHLAACPWCQIAKTTRRDSFPSPTGQQIALADPSLGLASIKDRIDILTTYIDMALVDAVLSADEKRHLLQIGQQLKIPQADVERIIREELKKRGAVDQSAGSAPKQQQAQLYFLNKHSIDFPDLEVNCGIKREVVLYANKSSASLSGTVTTDAPHLLRVNPAALLQNSGDLEVSLETSQLKWGRSYSQNVIINYNGVDSPKKIPVRFRVKDSKVALDAVKKLSKVMLIVSFVLGLLFNFILSSLGFQLTDFLPPDVVRPINSVFVVIASIGMLALGFAIFSIFGPIGITIGVIFVISHLVSPSLRSQLVLHVSGASNAMTGFFTNYLGIPTLIGTITGLSSLVLWRHSVEFLTQNGTNEKAQVITAAKILAPSVVFFGVFFLFALSQRGPGSSYTPPVATQPGTSFLSQITPPRPLTATEYYNRGLAYYNKGQHDQAFDDYNKAIALSPNYTFAYWGRGNVYFSRGQYDQAINDYSKAISANTDYADLYYSRGLAYSKKGQRDEARVDFQRACNKGNENGCKEAGMFATTPSQKSSNYGKPTIPDPKAAQDYYERGLAHYNSGQPDMAVNDYTKAITLNPTYTAAYLGRGRAYFDQGQYDKALDDCNKTIELNPNAEAFYIRGLIYTRRGRHGRAIKDYRAACDRGKKDACNLIPPPVTPQVTIREEPQKRLPEITISPGRYEVVRPTPLFKEPRSNSDVITWLDSETKVNITEATGDYLKVESKRGKPPGYISRKDVKPAQRVRKGAARVQPAVSEKVLSALSVPEESEKIDHFIRDDNGTVLDTRTGLMWMAKDFRTIEGRSPKNWDEAMRWADKMNRQNYGGYNDWRVPKAVEYQALIRSISNPSVFEEEAHSERWGYWSSDTYTSWPVRDSVLAVRPSGEAVGVWKERSRLSDAGAPMGSGVAKAFNPKWKTGRADSIRLVRSFAKK